MAKKTKYNFDNIKERLKAADERYRARRFKEEFDKATSQTQAMASSGKATQKEVNDYNRAVNTANAFYDEDLISKYYENPSQISEGLKALDTVSYRKPTYSAGTKAKPMSQYTAEELDDTRKKSNRKSTFGQLLSMSGLGAPASTSAIGNYYNQKTYNDMQSDVEEQTEEAKRTNTSAATALVKLYDAKKDNADFEEKSKKDDKIAAKDSNYSYLNSTQEERNAQRMIASSVGSSELSDNDRFLDTLTPEEIKVYNYIYKTEGKKSAKAYLNNLAAGDRGVQALRNTATEATEFADKYAIPAEAGRLFSMAPEGILSTMGLGASLTGNEVKANYFYQPSVASGAEQESIKGQVRDLSKEHMPLANDIVIAGKNYGNVYENAYTFLDASARSAIASAMLSGNAMAAFTSKAAGSVVAQALINVPISMSAYGDSYYKARESGMDDYEAKKQSFVDAGIEWTTEILGGFFGAEIQGNSLFAMMNNEALEEITGDIMNMGYDILDSIQSGNKNELQQEYEQLIAEGNSAKDAIKIMLARHATEEAITYLGTAVSMLPVGAGNAINTARTGSEIRSGNSNRTDMATLVNVASALSTDTRANKLAQKMSNGKISDSRVGELYNETVKEIQDTMNNATSVKELTNYVSNITDAIDRSSIGGQESATELTTAVAQSYQQNAMRLLAQESKKAQKTAQKAEQKTAPAKETVAEAPEIQKAINEQNEAKGVSVAFKANAQVDGSPVQLTSVASSSNDGIVFNTATNQKVSANDVEFDGKTRTVVNEALKGVEINDSTSMPLGTNGANAFIAEMGKDSDISFNTRSLYLKEAYLQGYTANESYDTLAQSDLFKTWSNRIGEAVVKTMFEAGVKDRQIETETKDKMSGTKRGVPAQTKAEAKGEVKAEESAPAKVNLFATALANATKSDIDINAESNAEGVNAFIDVETGKMTWNMDAEKGLTHAAGHEAIGEVIANYNPAEFAIIANTVLDYYRSQFGESFVARAKMSYKTDYQEGNKYTTVDDATKEMVCDGISAFMFGNEQGQKQFAGWLARNSDNYVIEKFKDIIKEIIDILNTFLKRENLNVAEKALIEMDKKSAQDFSKQIIDAYDTAIKNKNTPYAKSMEQLEENFAESGTVETEKAIREHFGEDQAIVADGKVVFSLANKDENINGLKAFLNSQSEFDEKEKNAIIKTMQALIKIAESVNGEEFETWKERQQAIPMVVADENGNTKFVDTFIVNNGEYILNIDATTLCKKRIVFDKILRELSAKYGTDYENLPSTAFAEIKDVLRTNGIEVACDNCFVDAKRYNVLSWAASFTNEWNELVESLTDGKDSTASYRSLFTDAEEEITPNALHTLTEEQRADKDKYYNFTTIDKILKKKKKKSENELERMARILKDNVLNGDGSMAFKLHPGQLTFSEGLDNLYTMNNDVFKLVNSHSGSAKPKLSRGLNVYHNDVLENDNFTPEEAFKVGGVRVQSFSDYIASMFVDYCQMFADLSAKKLPVHAYTKELVFAELFGMTGAKINLSLMPALNNKDIKYIAEHMTMDKDNKVVVKPEYKQDKARIEKEFEKIKARAGLDEKGNYVWARETVGYAEAKEALGKNATEDEIKQKAFEMAVELQKKKGYSSYVGTILVGISDAHIRKALRDPDIRMVIPYHKSSINPVIAFLTGIVGNTDYTLQQNTRYTTAEGTLAKVTTKSFGRDEAKVWLAEQGTTVDSFREQAEKELLEERNGKAPTEKQITDRATKLYNAEVKKKASEQIYAEITDKNGKPVKAFDDYEYLLSHPDADAKDAARAYLDHCKEYGLTPKFEQFIDEENYYKLLEDFNSFDSVTEENARQEAVQMRFPKNVAEILNKSLQTEQKAKEHLDKNEKKIFSTIEKRIGLGVYENAKTLSVNVGINSQYNLSPTLKQSRQVSIDDVNAYAKAAESGNEEEAQKLVDKAAMAWGAYSVDGKTPLPLYHGTDKFGFTFFDLMRMDDRMSVFATDDTITAQTYSGKFGAFPIGVQKNVDYRNMTNEELVDAVNDHYPNFRVELWNKSDFAEYKKQLYKTVDDAVTDIEELLRKGKTLIGTPMDNKQREEVNAFLDKFKSKTDLHGAMVQYYSASKRFLPYTKLLTQDLFNIFSYTSIELAERGADNMFAEFNKSTGKLEAFHKRKYLVDLLEYDAQSYGGNYKLYAKFARPLVVDAKKRNWRRIGFQTTPANPSNIVKDETDGLYYWINTITNEKISDGFTYKTDAIDSIPLSLYIQRYGVIGNGNKYYIVDRNGYALVRDALSESGFAEFDTRKDALKHIEKQYDNETITDGSPQWLNTTRQIAMYAKDMGYDGVVIHDVIDDGGRGELNSGVANTVTISFNPNQLKSADAITYDNEGNVIPLDERFSDNNDLRYSRPVDIGDVPSIIKENKELKKAVDYYKTMLGYNTDHKVDRKAIEKMAADLKSYWGTDMAKEDINEQLTKIVDYISSGNAEWQRLQEMGVALGKDIIDASKREIPAENQEILDNLKTYNFSLDDAQTEEVEYMFGGKRTWLNGIGKGMKYRTEGTALDTVWQEISKEYPSLFPADTPTAQQPIVLYEVMQTLTDTKAINGADYYDDNKLAAMIMLDIYDRSFELPEIVTPLDKAKKQLDQERIANRERLEAVRKADKAKFDKKLADLKRINESARREAKHAAEQKLADKLLEQRIRINDSARNRKLKSDLKRKIKNLKNNFDKNLLKPTERMYVPEQLFQEVIKICETLTEADRYYKNGNPIGTKKQLRLNDLALAYQNLANDETISWDYRNEYDEDFANRVNKLSAALKGKQISELSTTELSEVYDVLKSLYETMRDATKQIGQAEKISNHELAVRWIQETNGAQGFNKVTKGKYEQYVMNPMRLSQRYAEYNDNAVVAQMFDELEKGYSKVAKYYAEATKPFLELQRDTKAYHEYMTEEKDFGITDRQGNPIMLTEAQATAILLTAMDSDGFYHINNGAMEIADRKLLKKKGKGAALEHAKRTDTALGQQALDIANKLSDYGKKWLEAAQHENDVRAKAALNETSMAIKHKKIATSKHYAHLEVKKAQVRKEINPSEPDLMATLNSNGRVKDRVKKAGQTLIITDLPTMMKESIDFTSKYYGLAIPIRNLNKVYNGSTSKYYEPDMEQQTVREAIDNVWGTGATAVIESTVNDLQSSRSAKIYKNDIITNKLSSLKQGFIVATLASNISVAMKQAASYPTAAAILSWDSLAKGAIGFAKEGKSQRALWNEIDTHTGIHFLRRVGMIDTELGDLASSNSVINKVPAPLNPMKWIQTIDVKTTQALWLAAKAEVKSKYPNIEVGSDEYWDKVTELYEQVIFQTQPNYDVLHRPEMQRTANELSKMVFMFKTQPLQNSGILYDSLFDLQAKSRQFKDDGSEANKRALNEAKKKFAKAVTSQTISMLTFVTMTFLAGALKHKMFGFRDDDDEVTMESILKGFGTNIMSYTFGLMLPLLGSELFAVGEKITGKSRNDIISIPVVNTVNDFADSLQKVYKAAEGIQESGMTAESAKTLGNNVLDVLIKLAAIRGIPAGNAKQLVEGFVLNMQDIANGDFGKFKAGYENSNAGKYNVLTEAVNKGNEKAYDKEYERLVNNFIEEQGLTEEDARAELKKKLQSEYKAEYVENPDSREAIEDKLAMTELFTDEDYHKWLADAHTSDDMIEALESGDTDAFRTMMNEEIAVYRDKGLTEEEARKKVKSSIQTDYRQTYIDDSSQRSSIEATLNRTGLFTDEDYKAWEAESYSDEAMMTAFEGGLDTERKYISERLSAKVAAGQTQKQAEKNLRSSIARMYKDAYLNGDANTRATIITYMQRSGLYGSRNECIAWIERYWKQD